VEDAPAGLDSGRAAGAATLGVATSHSLDALTADALLTSLSDVRFNWDEQSATFTVADA